MRRLLCGVQSMHRVGCGVWWALVGSGWWAVGSAQWVVVAHVDGRWQVAGGGRRRRAPQGVHQTESSGSHDIFVSQHSNESAPSRRGPRGDAPFLAVPHTSLSALPAGKLASQSQESQESQYEMVPADRANVGDT